VTKKSAETVQIHEVSPRDGLQNEADILSVDAKLSLIENLVESGLTDIEVTSFVHPRWIPQLADAADVVARLPRAEDVRYWGLVPNQRGLERALDAGLRHVATFMSASETHNRKNLNRTRRESIANLRGVIAMAKDEDATVRAYISTVFGCPYEGKVDPAQAVDTALALRDAGADVLALGDTTGMGNPRQVAALVAAMVDAGIALESIALHLHDTRGTALANALAGFQAGVRSFDGSVAGLGGCPYAPGASGNAATEDLVHMFGSMGVSTGVDLDALATAGLNLASCLGRELPGRYHRYHAGTHATEDVPAIPKSKTESA
jgi:hydroxymethylglutaryl-CoA lyase